MNWAGAAIPFNPVKVVEDYRLDMTRFDVEQTELGRADFRAIAERLRSLWQDWQAEDSLHEMAFGEPDE